MNVLEFSREEQQPKKQKRDHFACSDWGFARILVLPFWVSILMKRLQIRDIKANAAACHACYDCAASCGMG